MNTSALWGSLVVVFSGVLLGSFSMPMKKTVNWSWEATWLVYSFVALLIVPWAVALVTTPDLFNIFSGVPGRELKLIFAYGLVWGLGSVFFGRSLYMIGISLAFSLNLGTATILGQLIPMFKDTSLFTKASGIGALFGCAVMIMGLTLCGIAGARKEKHQTPEQLAASEKTGKMFIGLLMAILAGVFSSFINFAFSFSDSLKAAAVSAGASESSATDPVWALALVGGFIPNALYCIYLFFRNRTWGDYKKGGTGLYWILGAFMGVIWMASVAFYGRGATRMGVLGASAGWAIFMGVTVLISNFWGFATGEWKGVKGAPPKLMMAGAALMLAAIAFIGYSASLE